MRYKLASILTGRGCSPILFTRTRAGLPILGPRVSNASINVRFSSGAARKSSTARRASSRLSRARAMTSRTVSDRILRSVLLSSKASRVSRRIKIATRFCPRVSCNSRASLKRSSTAPISTLFSYRRARSIAMLIRSPTVLSKRRSSSESSRHSTLPTFNTPTFFSCAYSGILA